MPLTNLDELLAIGDHLLGVSQTLVEIRRGRSTFTLWYIPLSWLSSWAASSETAIVALAVSVVVGIILAPAPVDSGKRFPNLCGMRKTDYGVQ